MKSRCIGVSILTILFLLAMGNQAKAEEYSPKKYPRGYIDTYPRDFADPYKFNPGRANRTPEGHVFASTETRTAEVQETYTKLNFSMEKVFGKTIPAKAIGGEKCLPCHAGIEEISPAHKDISCTKCHGGDGTTEDEKAAHKGMVSNPADLAVAAKYCGVCHEDHDQHIARVSGSLMSTYAGGINSTRYAWGAQSSIKATYATKAVGGLKTIPTYDESKELVDDLLRKKCLRCHLNSAAPNRQGDYRATGCAACHMVYANDGRTMTGDKAIQEALSKRSGKLDISGIGPNAKRGYPLVHKFTTAIPTVQCVRCHSGNRTGTDFLGMAEHDYEKTYRSPRFEGRIPPTLYGIEQHFLKSDIHYERGMACVDCHSQLEVHGDGKSYDLANQAVMVRCQDCHGTPTSQPKTKKVRKGDPAIKIAKSNPNYSVEAGDEVLVTTGGGLLANVQKVGKKLVLTSKITGKKHEISLLANLPKQPTNHQIVAHIDNMECHSCHARFVAQDYGLHLIREDYVGYSKWKRWRETDPNTMFILFSNLGSDVGDKVGKPNVNVWGMKPENPSPPESMDWLTGEKTLGVWWSAWSMRNWEDLVLGYNSRGKVSIFKPQFQYFVSHIGPDFAKAKNAVKAIKKKIGETTSEQEILALKRQLVEAEKKVDAQIFKDSEIPETQDGKIGLVMNPVAPHTTRTVVRRCEKCHQHGNAAGIGNSQFSAADKKNVPLMQPQRMGLPMDFQLSQMVAEDGEALQSTTHPGAAPFSAAEVKALMGKSKAYGATRYLDLVENNYLTIKDRKNLTGGAKRAVIPRNSMGDVREVGSYYDWRRYGFWQTDPVVFADEFFTAPDPEKLKTDFSKDPAIIKEQKEIEERSLTFGDEINRDWRPKK